MQDASVGTLNPPRCSYRALRTSLEVLRTGYEYTWCWAPCSLLGAGTFGRAANGLRDDTRARVLEQSLEVGRFSDDRRRCTTQPINRFRRKNERCRQIVQVVALRLILECIKGHVDRVEVDVRRPQQLRGFRV